MDRFEPIVVWKKLYDLRGTLVRGQITCVRKTILGSPFLRLRLLSTHRGRVSITQETLPRCVERSRRRKNGQIWTNSPIKIVISLNCHISSHICHNTWDFFGLQCNSHSITINLFFVSKWIQTCCVNMLNVLWRWATNQSSTTTSAHTSSWFFKKVSWGIPEIIS